MTVRVTNLNGEGGSEGDGTTTMWPAAGKRDAEGAVSFKPMPMTHGLGIYSNPVELCVWLHCLKNMCMPFVFR